MKVAINPTTNILTITTDKVSEYSDLFDELGEHEVVMANEVDADYIACEGLLYSLDVTSVRILMNGGEVELSMIEKVIDCGDEDFIKWYF